MQVKDGIGNQLTGTVESHVATAIALEQFDPFGFKVLTRRQHISSFGVAAEGNNRRVLEQGVVG